MTNERALYLLIRKILRTREFEVSQPRYKLQSLTLVTRNKDEEDSNFQIVWNDIDGIIENPVLHYKDISLRLGDESILTLWQKIRIRRYLKLAIKRSKEMSYEKLKKEIYEQVMERCRNIV